MATLFPGSANRDPSDLEIRVDGQEIAAFYGELSEVTVDWGRDRATTATLKLDSRRDETGRWRVQDAGVFEPWTTVRLVVHFGARAEEVMRGYIRLVKTPSGHLLRFDDESGEEAFTLSHPAGASVTIDKDGTVVVTDAEGSRVSLDAAAGEVSVADANGNAVEMTSGGIKLADLNGNEIAMEAAGITVKAAKVTLEVQQVELGGAGGEPVIKGQSFVTMFMTHTHPHPLGPTAPPIPQGEMSTLSIKTKTS